MDGGRTGTIIDRAERTLAGAEPSVRRPSRAAAEAAVRTLLEWAGDDPSREGLSETLNPVLRRRRFGTIEFEPLGITEEAAGVE